MSMHRFGLGVDKATWFGEGVTGPNNSHFNFGRGLMSDRTRLWAGLLILGLLMPVGQVPLVKKKKRPDLVPTSLSSDTVAGVHLQLKNVVADIVNQGKRPAGPFRVRYFL